VRLLIAAVQKRSAKPVRTLVNTHWHGDHTQGNGIWREVIGDDLEIIGHSTHVVDIEKRAKAQALSDADELEETLRQAEAELTAGRGLQGETLDDDGRTALRARLDRNYAYLEAQRSIRWEQPTRTFEDRLILERGDRRIELRHYRGHTRGDVVVYLPAEKVLITGDLVDDLPYGGHGNPREWLATLRELEKIDFEIMIPGHGRVRHGKDHLRVIIRLVESILEQVGAAVATGADLETTQKQVDLSEFHALLVTDDVAERNFGDFMPATIEQAWLEARGEWTDGSP
jgi:glyoxylase-like metal-dependent hydrolase (beta-lactamase superfamily II)